MVEIAQRYDLDRRKIGNPSGWQGWTKSTAGSIGLGESAASVGSTLDLASANVHKEASSVKADTIAQTYGPRLRAAGLRVTQPRLAILEVLHGSAEPMTIENVHASLSRSDCDLVTVYRCLDAFERIGLVKRFYLRNGTTAFAAGPAGENLFVISANRCRAAEVSPEVTRALREAIAAIERHLAQLGYGEVTGLVEFFAEPAEKK